MMQLLAPRWALVLAVAVAGGSSAVGEPASSLSHVATLVARLGSADYRQREAAHRELAALGPAALGPLEHATEHEDLEVSLRAKQLLGDLQRDAKWSGSRLRVPHAAGALELLAAIRGQTGVDVALERDFPAVGSPPVVLPTGEVEFWPAVDGICAALNSAPRWQFTTCGKSRLVARELGPRGTAAYEGALRCEISGPPEPAGAAVGKTEGSELTLHLAWEPKLNVVAVQAVPRIRIAGMEGPISLVSAPSGCTHEESWHVTAQGLPCYSATIRLRAPFGDANGTHVQSVQWGVIAVASDGSHDPRTVRFQFHKQHAAAVRHPQSAASRQADDGP